MGKAKKKETGNDGFSKIIKGRVKKLKEEKLDMRSLLNSKEKHLLWQDDLGDDFILLKYCEIFRYSQDEIQLCFWNKNQSNIIRKMIPNFDYEETDDRMYYFKANIRYLPQIIALGAFKRRPHLAGKWLKDKEEKLGHEILPYKPESLKNEPGGKIPKQFQK